MNTNMLEHEAVQRNMATLAARGVQLRRSRRRLSRLRLDRQGPPRRTGAIVEAARPAAAAARARCSAGSCVVTAGPTYEDIDAVRYIGNRSSGKMGYAVAAEAARRGARVVLVSGPSHLDAAAGRRGRAGPARGGDARRGARRGAREADIVVMAAAVADYTPARRRARRQDREEPMAPLELTLVRTPDILAELGRPRAGAPRPVLVGFAAESGDPVARGREKLRAEGRRLDRRQRHHAAGRRLRLRLERRDDHQRGRRGARRSLSAWAEDRARRAHPRPRRAPARSRDQKNLAPRDGRRASVYADSRSWTTRSSQNISGSIRSSA